MRGTMASKTTRVREYEAEVAPGIERIAMSELREKTGGRLSDLRKTRAGFLRFGLAHTADFSQLRSVIAIYHIHHFDIPRPRALLGHERFTRLCQILRSTGSAFDTPADSFGIGAAGSQTAVMRRLRDELSHALDLPHADDGKGQLYMRLAPGESGGWNALVRMTPAPMSKRSWRVDDVPGALNATVAFAMTTLAQLPRHATVVNLCGGSSTILIEHALSHPQHRLFSIDHDADTLKAGKRNAAAANANINHLLADARATPLTQGCADLLHADLPFGNLVGSHEDNQRLYPALLREAARLALDDALFIVITQEIRLLRRCLRATAWRVMDEIPITLSGLHPRIFALQRT